MLDKKKLHFTISEPTCTSLYLSEPIPFHEIAINCGWHGYKQGGRLAIQFSLALYIIFCSPHLFCFSHFSGFEIVYTGSWAPLLVYSCPPTPQTSHIDRWSFSSAEMKIFCLGGVSFIRPGFFSFFLSSLTSICNPLGYDRPNVFYYTV